MKYNYLLLNTVLQAYNLLLDLTATGLNKAPKNKHCNKIHPSMIKVNFHLYFADKYSTNGAKTNEPTPNLFI